MISYVAAALVAAAAGVSADVAHTFVDPRAIAPAGVPVIADAPVFLTASAAPSLLQLQHPIDVSEPLVLPEDLEERQDTVVRQTSSSGKLQHILRAHYVGTLDNEQRFEAQDASEPVPLPKTPRVSLNDLYFAPPPPEEAPIVATVAPVLATAAPYPYPYPAPLEASPAPYPYPFPAPAATIAPYPYPASLEASPAPYPYPFPAPAATVAPYPYPAPLEASPAPYPYPAPFEASPAAYPYPYALPEQAAFSTVAPVAAPLPGAQPYPFPYPFPYGSPLPARRRY